MANLPSLHDSCSLLYRRHRWEHPTRVESVFLVLLRHVCNLFRYELLSCKEKRTMIVVVDSGLGNVGSVANMLRKVTSQQSVISNDIKTISEASKIILPGVGHFDKGMENLDRLGLISTLTIKAMEQRVPFLGICLGMQMMA